MTTAMEWPVVFSLVSHELRSPAAVIAGYAHMLRQGQLGDDDRQKVLVQIERAAGTIQQVGRHASEVSRWLSAPASIPAVDHVSLETLVTRAVARSASASRITTHFSAGVDAAPVRLLDREALAAALSARVRRGWAGSPR